MERYFSREDIQVANMYMKRCAKSLVIRERQIKASRYNFTPDKVAIIKSKKEKKKRSVGEDAEKSEHIPTADGNVKWCGCFGKQFGCSSES